MKYIYWLAATLVVVSVLLLFVLPTWMKKEMEVKPVVFKEPPLFATDTLSTTIYAWDSSMPTAIITMPPEYYIHEEIKKLRKELLVAIEKKKCTCGESIFLIPFPPPNETLPTEIDTILQYGAQILKQNKNK